MKIKLTNARLLLFIIMVVLFNNSTKSKIPSSDVTFAKFCETW